MNVPFPSIPLRFESRKSSVPVSSKRPTVMPIRYIQWGWWYYLTTGIEYHKRGEARKPLRREEYWPCWFDLGKFELLWIYIEAEGKPWVSASAARKWVYKTSSTDIRKSSFLTNRTWRSLSWRTLELQATLARISEEKVNYNLMKLEYNSQTGGFWAFSPG
jgi:hypothetical protein